MESSTYKHADILSSIPNCPPVPREKLNGSVFRVVFEDLSETKSFTPQLLSQPSRFNSASDKDKCENCSLSMYTSIDKLKKKFRSMSDVFFRNNGSLIAEAVLNPYDGDFISTGKMSGHINVYLFESVVCSERFKIVDSITRS